MKNIERVIIGLIILMGILLISTNTKATNGYEIDAYDIKIIVNEDNTYNITEKITANFQVPRHGIIRNIPLQNTVVRNDGTSNKNKAKITDIYVDNICETSKESGKISIKIGSGSKTITGKQVYTIRYKYDIGRDKNKTFDEFYYNIIGNEWDTTISNVTFKIIMPKKFDENLLGFSTGKKGTIGNENVIYKVSRNNITGSYNGTLHAGEALTVRLTLDEGYYINSKITISPTDYLMYIIPIISLIISYFLWLKFGKDDKVIDTVEFYPPDGYNSLDLGFMYKGKCENKDITSLLIYLANKGYIKIEDENKAENKKSKLVSLIYESNKYKFIKLKEYDDNNENERIFLNGLFEKSDEVSLRDLESRFYRTTNKIRRRENSKENRNKIFEKATKSKSIIIILLIILSLLTILIIPAIAYGEIEKTIPVILMLICFSMFSTIPFLQRTRKIEGVMSIFLFLVVAIVMLQSLNIFDMFLDNPIYIYGFIIGILCIIAMFILYKVMPKRTAYGNEILGRIRGFKDFLENAEKDSLEQLVMEDPEYFYNILPYTYVLNVSSKWINKFESITMEPPNWYESNTMFNITSFGNSINRAMTSASYAMTSTPSSNSSFGGSSGGGFSGGGSGRRRRKLMVGIYKGVQSNMKSKTTNTKIDKYFNESVMKKRYIDNQGITLIVLVITIVILLILAGVVINLALGKSGILNKSKEAKEKTQYAHALEIVNLKILDANIEKISLDQRICNIEELADYMGKSEELEVTIVKYYEVATVSNSLVKPEKISGFLVKAVVYPKYTFKIGEFCNIESVSTDEGNTLIPINEFNISIGEPEISQTISSFGELLNKNGIIGTYTKQDVANNKDGVLEIILSNENSVEYIFNNPEEYIDILTNSQEAMTLLGQNKEVREKVIDNELWCEKIANSEYRANYSEYIVYNENTLLGTAGGRTYNKKNRGSALAAAYIRKGAEFILVSKDKNSVISWCSYSPSFESSEDNEYVHSRILQLNYNNTTWYYSNVPFEWINGTGISSNENSKYIGNFEGEDSEETYKQVAIYILNNYFEK